MKSRIVHLIKHNAFVQAFYRFTMSAFFRFIGLFIKIDDNLVLMNGHGSKYNDSPRDIFRKMDELGLTKKYKVVWALNDPDKYDIENCEKIKMDTFKYFKTALKAKYWVSCVNIERGLHFKKKKTVYLNTWHGALINLCGNAVGGRKDFRWKYVDYFCVCGDYEKPFIVRDFGVREDALIMTGYPRNDMLYSANAEKVKQIKEDLGLPLDKKIILYAPTWRETVDGGSSYQLAPPIDWKKWKEALSDKYVVLLRTHPYTTKLMNVEFDDFVKNFTEYPEVNHLLLAADVLISDYSSINLDYCILEKPMICFGYDYDEYKSQRGFYYDLEENMPNGVVKNEDDVISLLLNMNVEEQIQKTAAFKQAHMQYGGNASVECINKLFGTDYS